MKNRKGILVLFLFVHLMVHPMLHAAVTPSAPLHPTLASDTEQLRGADDCSLCRVSTTLILLAVLALITVAVSGPKIRVSFVPKLWSADFLLHLPSRAPPTLA
ncbi:MAG TPA: hypothetical protein VF135_01325 [Terriglobales bacterium]